MPTEHDKYLMKPSLIVQGQGQSKDLSTGKKKEFVVRVIGEGTIGEIKVLRYIGIQSLYTYFDFFRSVSRLISIAAPSWWAHRTL
jgi:hypothetical protein